MEKIVMFFWAFMIITILLTLSMTLAALVSTIIVLVLPLVVILSLVILALRFKYSGNKSASNGKISIGFFHPYCTAGGGGERVLWCAIKTVQDNYNLNDIECIVYTGDSESDEDIFKKIKNTFDIELKSDNVVFKRLTKRKWVEASTYPRFTLIGQSLGSMILGWEALSLHNPTIFFDTMGYAFTFPIFSLIANCTIACYVHYPTISSDMITSVKSSSESFNNDKSISSNKFKTYSKLLYYIIFSKIYWLVGSFSKLVLVNGTWTGNHIASIWKKEFGKDLFVVYPPVDVENRKEIPLGWMDGKRSNMILSIAQFRPEKNHSLQLKTLAHLLDKYPIHRDQLNTKLVLVGGVRDQGDRDRVEALRQEAIQLGIQDNVDFKISISSTALNQLLSEASVGIHTMYNEHFGIGVVELMAAGVIPVANNSAGPKEDIVHHDITGFLASTKEEYAEYIHEILAYREKYTEMQKKARESTERFSESNFNSQFLNFIKPLIQLHNINNKKIQ